MMNAVFEEGGSHRRVAVINDEGVLGATTVLSRSWRKSDAPSSAMVGTIAREPGPQGQTREFLLLLACPLGRDEYLAMVTEDR